MISIGCLIDGECAQARVGRSRPERSQHWKSLIFAPNAHACVKTTCVEPPVSDDALFGGQRGGQVAGMRVGAARHEQQACERQWHQPERVLQP